MSPRGYWSKEYIAPYFTSEEYKYTEAYQHEVEFYTSTTNRLRSIIKYPRKVYNRFMVWIASWYV